jgi:hypothetical protein
MAVAETTSQAVDEQGAPEAILEPSEDDRPLQGPLHLRNLPAADEPFLRRLSEKLEDSIKTNDTAPSVLRSNSASDCEEKPLEKAPAPRDTTGADGTHDNHSSVEDDVEDVPLKLRNTSNFGLPLGDLGSFTGR